MDNVKTYAYEPEWYARLALQAKDIVCECGNAPSYHNAAGHCSAFNCPCLQLRTRPDSIPA